MRTTQKIFSYGLLQKSEVQLDILNRKLKGKSDVLIGYVKHEKALMDTYPTIECTNKSSDKVKGTLYEVSNLDLYHIDLYESLAYTRKQVVLASGANAWVYIPNLG